MTDTTEEVEDSGPEIPPRKWCWWLLPAMVFGLMGNFGRAWSCFFDEIAMAFTAHSIWKAQKKESQLVESFREQLNSL